MEQQETPQGQQQETLQGQQQETQHGQPQQETLHGQQQKSTDMTWAGPARPADTGATRPHGADQSARMELAAEPSPDVRHLPAGGLPPATRYPGPEPERVLLVAIFDNPNAADDCAADLGRRGVDVAVRLMTDPNARQEAGAQADQQTPPRRLGGRVTLGATLGATAGLLASTFVVPEAATGVPTMLTTLVGAGLGSYWGRHAGGATQQAGAGASGDNAAAQSGQQRVLLVARVDEDQSDAVQDRILTWNPVELRVQ